MKKLLAVLFAAILMLATAACGSDDSSSDDSSSDTADEDASASASKPADDDESQAEDEDEDTSTSDTAEQDEDASASEPSDEELPTGMDDAVASFDETFDLTDDEEECLTDAVLDDPDLLDLDESQIESDPDTFNLVFGLLRDCVGDERLGDALAAEFVGPGVDETQAACLGTEFVDLDPELWAELIMGSNDPGYSPSADVQAALLDMFSTCDIDPLSIPSG